MIQVLVHLGWDIYDFSRIWHDIDWGLLDLSSNHRLIVKVHHFFLKIKFLPCKRWSYWRLNFQLGFGWYHLILCYPLLSITVIRLIADISDIVIARALIVQSQALVVYPTFLHCRDLIGTDHSLSSITSISVSRRIISLGPNYQTLCHGLFGWRGYPQIHHPIILS